MPITKAQALKKLRRAAHRRGDEFISVEKATEIAERLGLDPASVVDSTAGSVAIKDLVLRILLEKAAL